MKIHLNKYLFSLSLCAAMGMSTLAMGQDVIQIDPIFEYPSAPENLTSLTDKSNYLMEHFWDPMDLKSNAAVDQNALNDAMKVYSAPLRWAELSIAEANIDKLIEKLSKNPTLLTQFTKAAEEVLYGPRAEFWVDDVYVKFLDAYTKNKKIPASRKTKYEKQLVSLRNSKVGETAPEFSFTDKNGEVKKYTPMSTPTILIFGNPEDTDWRMTRLNLETTVPLRQALEQGKLNILYIVPFESGNWKDLTSNYPTTWTVGTAPEVGNTLDIRTSPSVYLVGGDGKIILKNATVSMAVNEGLNLINK